MKYLFIAADRYPPFRVDVKVLFGEKLAGKGHEIDWLLQSRAECAKAYRTRWGGGEAWVAATDLGDTRRARLRKHLRAIGNDLRMIGLTRRKDYDFIQVKDKFISAAIALWTARLRGIPFIYWLSYPYPEEYLAKAGDPASRYPFLYRIRGEVFRFLLYKVILPSARHVFVQSEQMKLDIEREGVDGNRMTPVPMGVDLEKVTWPFPEGGAEKPEGEKWLVYLGTFRKVRRIDFLVRVLAVVLGTEPRAVLYLVGSGDDESDKEGIMSEARRLGVAERVRITGFLPREEALSYVHKADVCLSPYVPTPLLNSTSPTKLIEYMSLNKVVVANDHPEQRRVIEESGAGICVPYEEGAFAAAVCSLLADTERAVSMGARGRAYVARERSYEVISERLHRKYGEILRSA